jgi:hypothetical protein
LINASSFGAAAVPASPSANNLLTATCAALEKAMRGAL